MRAQCNLLLLSSLQVGLYAQTLVIENANVIDGLAMEPIRGATVAIENAKLYPSLLPLPRLKPAPTSWMFGEDGYYQGGWMRMFTSHPPHRPRPHCGPA